MLPVLDAHYEARAMKRRIVFDTNCRSESLYLTLGGMIMKMTRGVSKLLAGKSVASRALLSVLQYLQASAKCASAWRGPGYPSTEGLHSCLKAPGRSSTTTETMLAPSRIATNPIPVGFE